MGTDRAEAEVLVEHETTLVVGIETASGPHVRVHIVALTASPVDACVAHAVGEVLFKAAAFAFPPTKRYFMSTSGLQCNFATK